MVERGKVEVFDQLVVSTGHGGTAAVAEDEVGDVGDGAAPVLYGFGRCLRAQLRDHDVQQPLPGVEGRSTVRSHGRIFFHQIFVDVRVPFVDR